MSVFSLLTILHGLYAGVLPVLEQLLEQSATTKYAYLCHPEVEHVSKLKREGEPHAALWVFIALEDEVGVLWLLWM